MTTSEWFEWCDIDKEAMLHVEGRKPKLIVQNWQWKTVTLNSERNNITKA